MMRKAVLVLVAAALGGAGAMPVVGQPVDSERMLEAMMQGRSPMDDAALARRIAEAEKHPLGSPENPVRAEMPQGQRAYLARLRCADGKAPRFNRVGNVGPGIYMSIVDLYDVDCGEAAPGRVKVQMDMYHKGHVEDRAVPGFTIAPAGNGAPGANMS